MAQRRARDTQRPPSALDFALLRGALEEVPLGVATTRDGVIMRANEALERLYGARPGSLAGRPVDVLFDAASLVAVRACLAEAQPFDGKLSARSLDGTPLDLEVHIERYRSEAQSVGGFLVIRRAHVETVADGAVRESYAAIIAPEPLAAAPVPPTSPAAPLPVALHDLGRDMLREVSQLMASVAAESGALRSSYLSSWSAVPAGVSGEIAAHLRRIDTAAAAASTLGHKLRRAGEARLGETAIGDVLGDVCTILGPIVGEHLTVSIGAADHARARAAHDELVLALTHLALRTFRSGGGGTLRVGAYVTVSPPSSPPGTTRSVGESRLIIDLIAEPPAGSEHGAISGFRSALPRPDEAERVLRAVQVVLEAAGATLEPEEVTARWARTIVRVPVSS